MKNIVENLTDPTVLDRWDPWLDAGVPDPARLRYLGTHCDRAVDMLDTARRELVDRMRRLPPAAAVRGYRDLLDDYYEGRSSHRSLWELERLPGFHHGGQ